MSVLLALPPLTVRHSLTECVDSIEYSDKYFVAFSTEKSFEIVDIYTVFDFIKEIHFHVRQHV